MSVDTQLGIVGAVLFIAGLVIFLKINRPKNQAGLFWHRPGQCHTYSHSYSPGAFISVASIITAALVGKPPKIADNEPAQLLLDKQDINQ
jgi:hypothetical protein